MNDITDCNQISTIELDTTTGPIKLYVAHNLPETFGQTLQDAVLNWVFRTTDYTVKSLNKYINDKTGGEYFVKEIDEDTYNLLRK